MNDRPERDHTADAGPDFDKCRICHIRRDGHTTLETSGQVRHAFSEHGELVEVDPDKVGKPPSPAPDDKPRILIAPQPDLVLRRLLVDKGIVTQDEIDKLSA